METKLEPYVGPRPFERADQAVFFGRDREANDLRSLIVANPVTLLYAQSGAGKTSLINARLIPLLEKEGFETILPTARVRGRAPEGLDFSQIPSANIYVFNAVMGWSGQNNSPQTLAQKSLSQLLAERPAQIDEDGLPKPRVMIFDQLEELFTFYPERWKDRRGFFEQIAAALGKDRLLRVVFSMREDYIAELDPYLSLLPENLRTRFRLERLREQSALPAVEQPLRGTDLHFAPGVALQLVKNLLRIPVRAQMVTSEVEGEFIEPVQLQVVCQTLWESLHGSEKKEITEEDLRTFGDVNRALSSFYERTIQKVTDATEINEGQLRRWFENTLITQAGTRGTVFRGPENTGGIPNAAIDELDNQHIIRAELRGGERWYELSHDRFIPPIRESNKRWLLQRSSAEQTRQRLEAMAVEWVRLGRSNQGLLDEGELLEAERWLASPEAADLSCSETLMALIEKSRSEIDKAARQQEFEQKESAAREREAQALAASQQLRLRQFRFGLVALGILLMLMAGLTVYAFRQRAAATRAQAEAVKQANTANRLKEEAEQLNKSLEDQRNRAQDEAKRAQHAEMKAYEATSEAKDQRAKADAQAAVARKAEAKERAAKEEAFTQAALTDEALSRAEDAKTDAERAAREADRQKTIAEEALTNAEKQKKIAVSRGIAFSARSEAPTDPELGLLLAVKSVEVSPTKQAEETLRATLPMLSKMALVIRGNTDWVPGANFSPDGKLIVTAAYDQKARVWDANTGKFIIEFVGHTDAINSAVFSPDGKFVLTASRDKSARLWDVTTGKDRLLLLGHTDTVYDAAFSPDGALIATASTDKTARVWEAATGRPVFRELVGHTDWVNSVAFHRNSKLVLTASSDNTAKIWDAVTGEVLQSLAHPTDVTSAAFSRDGKLVVTTLDDGTAKVWNTAGELLKTLAGHNTLILKATFSPDSKSIVTASADKTAKVWDVSSGKMLVELRGHVGGVLSAAFSPDGKLVLTSGVDKTARVWRWEENKEPVIQLSGHAGGVSSAEFSPDGNFVITAGRDGAARIWEKSTGRMLKAVAPSETGRRFPVKYAAFSPDGRLFVTASEDFIVRIWRTESSGFIELRGHEDIVNSAVFSPDGNLIVSASDDKTARVWDAATGREIRLLKGHKEAVTFAVFSPDGRTIATASKDGRTRLWDSASGRTIAELAGHSDGVTRVAFSLRGDFIVTASLDKTAIIWTRASASDLLAITKRLIAPGTEVFRVVRTLRSETEVYDAQFSPDGERIVTANENRTAQIWKVASGEREYELTGHSNWVRTAAFSPDGNFIVTASADFTARIYPRQTLLSLNEVLELALDRIRTSGRKLTEDEHKRFMAELPND